MFDNSSGCGIVAYIVDTGIKVGYQLCLLSLLSLFHLIG